MNSRLQINYVCSIFYNVHESGNWKFSCSFLSQPWHGNITEIVSCTKNFSFGRNSIIRSLRTTHIPLSEISVNHKWNGEIIHGKSIRGWMMKNPPDYKSTQMSHKDTGSQTKVTFVQGPKLFTL
jgi:hypothetical protein